MGVDASLKNLYVATWDRIFEVLNDKVETARVKAAYAAMGDEKYTMYPMLEAFGCTDPAIVKGGGFANPYASDQELRDKIKADTLTEPVLLKDVIATLMAGNMARKDPVAIRVVRKWKQPKDEVVITTDTIDGVEVPVVEFRTKT